METFIKIAIVDDYELMRTGLRMEIEKIENTKVVSEFENGKAFVDSLDKQNLDIVFMDIDMPVMNGIEATHDALLIQPGLKVIALTRGDGVDTFHDMLEAGAVGFLLKNVNKNTIERAIMAIMKGNNYFSEELLDILSKSYTHPKKKEEQIKLTSREQEILELLCKGMQSSEISEKLFLSSRTVDGYRASMISKVDVKNTASLILYAIKNKLVQLE